ncbi:MAG TPA: acetyl-CoA carboxylase biotin carboxyl carrier protein [Solirubrobacterales bacterium]|nr:acetyl-CoA carboxylase biotin carboxyl carrier protein [Solirubrobacterales bacterium]
MDLKELKQLLQILEEKQIAEFEIEEAGIKLRIKKAGAATVITGPAAVPIPAPVAPPVPSAEPTTEPGPTAVSKPVEAGLTIVKSPIVGTFYRSPDPNAAPFVSVGDSVKVGQKLCIIEAMKLMNEIESELAGEVVEVYPENGQPVQYGEPLLSIRPSR